MYPTTEALYADLAKVLGVDELKPDAQGSVQLSVGETSTVLIFAENAESVMLVSPVMELPAAIDYGRVLWLLRRNFYDSPLAPFRIGCDTASSLVIWGRVPTAGLTGQELANLIDAVATEADTIREEVAVEDAG
ncbi:type III secretion system chaperone [Pelomonas sp. KK5]|uniref:type III secretion system chaperone n=1 Tax=Pelomonas sp. KK5 TaxID=1855730 RepID=UPI00097BFECF|nr:type III secretion system chaperone [Pelomonas sp. KK5]